MARPRVLLAWEGGMGRGHIVNLRHIAEDIGTGCEFDAALCDLTYKEELEPFCTMVFQGVRLGSDMPHRKGDKAVIVSSMGEYYTELGLRDPEKLRDNVAWWINTFNVRKINLLIGEYCLFAFLAARIRGVPALIAGTSFGAPPSDMPKFLPFIPENNEDVYSEAETVQIINDVLGPMGLPPLRYLSDVWTRAGDLISGFSLMDHFADYRQFPLLPPKEGGVLQVAPDGKEIFAYFSTTEFDDPALEPALLACPHSIRAYIPNASEDLKERLRAGGLILEDKPVSPQDIARRSRMMLNSAQYGTVNMAFGMGLPQLGLPQQLEQLYISRIGERHGVMQYLRPKRHSTEEILAAICGVYDSEDMRRNAAKLSESLKPELLVDRKALTRQRVQAAFDTRRLRAQAPATL